MSTKKTFLASTFLIILSACSGECSCGTTNNDDGEGGAGGGSTVSTGGNGTGGETSTTTGTGGNGTGGQGTGGEGTGGGTGGTGGGGTGGGGGGDGVCQVVNVADPATCDIDCDVSVEGADNVHMCTISCDPEVGCGDDAFACVVENEGDAVGFCLYDCSVEACPGVSEYVCDQDLLSCIPDGLSD